MEQPKNLRTKKPRLMDDQINSAQARYQAASERMAFHQGELEKARAEMNEARKELQNHGSAAYDSLLILKDDCFKYWLLPCCDWKTLLRFGGTCKKLFQLTEMEWKSRFQKIDKSSRWLVYDEEGEIDYDSTNSFCKLHTVRFEKAAAYAKKLEPKVQDHIVVEDDDFGRTICLGCSEFPSQTNVECFRATKHYGFFLRIFSPSVDEDQSSLLWQGFVDTKVTDDREDFVQVLLTGFDSNNNNVLPHLKDYLQLLQLIVKEEDGILSEDEQEWLLQTEPKHDQMEENAVGNIGFIVVALNPSDEMVSLIHATSQPETGSYLDTFVGFKHMKPEIHGNDEFITNVSAELDTETQNLCIALIYQLS